MLLSLDTITKHLPVFKLELFNEESVVVSHSFWIEEIVNALSMHFKCQFKVLSCISGLDYSGSFYRFRVVYDFLSIKFNSRIRVKVATNELTPVNSIEKTFPSASWWESETWDMFGIFFDKQENLVRLLTDYGFQGYPLRKDFPLSGYLESRYSTNKNKVVYDNLELSQEYRIMDFLSTWEVIQNEKNTRKRQKA